MCYIDEGILLVSTAQMIDSGSDLVVDTKLCTT